MCISSGGNGHSERRWLEIFLIWQIPMAVLIGVLSLRRALPLSSPLHLLIEVLLFGYAGVLVFALFLARHGHMTQASVVSTSGLLVVAIVDVFLDAAAFPIALLLPLMAVILALPHMRRILLGVFVVLSWLATVAVVVLFEADQGQLANFSIDTLVLITTVAVILAGIFWMLIRNSQRMAQVLSQSQAAHAVIHEREMQLRAALQAAQMGIWSWDFATDRITVSIETAQLFGLPHGSTSCTCEAFMARIHPDDHDRVAAAIEEGVQQATAYESEYRIYGSDGKIRWIAATCSIVRDDNGQVREMMGTVQDITGRKESENALRASEARYQRMAANTPGMVYQFVLRPDGSNSFTFASEGCRALFHQEPQAIENDAELVLGFMNPTRRQEYEYSTAVSAATLQPWSWEGSYTLSTGEERWVQAVARPERQPNGDVLWDGLVVDLTDRWRAEQQNQVYTDIVKNIPLGLYVLRLDDLDDPHSLRLLMMNPMAQQLFGVSPEDTVGSYLTTIFPDVAATPIPELCLEVVRSGQAMYLGEFRCDHDQAKAGVFALKAFPLPDRGVGLAFENVTERVEAEEALRRRDAILEAVGFAARRLLESATWHEAMPDVIAHLGAATQVSRVYIFENHSEETGKLFTSQRYEWSASEIEPQADNPVLQNVALDTFFSRWTEVMQQGDVIHGPVHAFEGAEREHLEAQQIRSILTAPIYVGRTWWGFIGFDDCMHERAWSSTEIDALCAAVATLGTMIQRQQTEESLRQNRILLEGIIDHAPLAIGVRDLQDGRYLLINRLAAEAIGQEQDALIGKSFADYYPSDWVERSRAEDELIHVTGAPLQREHHMVHANGSVQTYLSTKFPISDAHGSIYAIGSLHLNMTERKAMEEELRRLNVELEQRVAARTVELASANAQLRISEAQQRRHAARTTALAELSRTLAVVTLDHATVLDLAVRTIADLFGDLCILRMLSEDAAWLELTAAYHPDPQILALVHRYITDVPQSVHEGMFGHVASTGDALLLPTITPEAIRTASPAMYQPFLDRVSVKGAVVVPLLAQGRLIGVLGVLRTSSAHAYTDDDQEFLQDLADRVALAISNVRLFQTVQQELAERKRAEASLRESRHFNERAMEATPSLVYVYDIDTKSTIFSNRATFDSLGYRMDDITAMGDAFLATVMHPDDYDRVPALFTEYKKLRDGEISENEFRLRSISGEWRWFNSRDLVFGRDAEGHPHLMLGTAQDVTVRKEAEAALTEAYTRLESLNQDLQRSRDVLRTIFDGLDTGLLLLDRSSTVLALNQTMTALLGVAAEAALGRSWLAVCRRDEQVFPAVWATETLHDGTARHKRERAILHDGVHHVLDIQTLPLHGADQTVEQMVVHIVDVTEQVQIEAQLIEHERFAASGRLAATVAHEVNTPLQALVSLLHLAEQSPDMERTEYLRLAQEEILRVGRILHQLLNLYRLDASIPTSIDLNALLERVSLLTGFTMSRHGITLEQDLMDDLPQIWGRADEITQVLLNLIFNALDATPRSGALRLRTTVRALPAQETEAEPFVVIDVADTGVGIPVDLQSRIFEPFFSTKTSGTGLGLSICRQIMLRHGGTIQVQSTRNRGSTFTLAFPLQRMEKAAFFEC